MMPFAGVAILASTLFTACLKNHDDDNQINIPVAGLMAFNLAVDKPSVGFALSGNQLTSSPLAYNSYTGVYLNIYTGTRSVESYDYYSGNTIASSSFDFDSSKFYSVFLTGTNGNYRNVAVEDKFDDLSSTSGQAYIRYINAIPDSSHPNVTITAGGTNVINENAAYASVSNFTAVPPGSVDIKVNNGSNINANRTITVEQRKIYTVLLSPVPGTPNSDSVQIKFITNGELDQSTQRSSSASSMKTLQ